MKKLTKLFLTLCIVGLFTFIASCGGKVTPKTYKVVFETKGGSIVKSVNVEENTELTFPTDPTKDGFEFAGWYLDENYTEKVTIPYVVTKDIIFYANWKVLETTEILVNVVEQRASFELFEDNRSVKTNKRTEFFDLTKQYLVGDDNPWKVKPSVSFVKRNKVTGDIEYNVEVTSWEYEIVITEIMTNGGTMLAAEELIENIDTTNCTIDFSEKAIGKTFKVEVTPKGLTEKQQSNKDKYTVAFECQVEDGFNVYDAKELGYIDTRTTDSAGEAWKAFKEANGMDVNYKPTNLFFQNNINITVDSVPSYFFYTKEEIGNASDAAIAVGSLKDYEEFYNREMLENETLGIYGNYFTLNVAEIPLVVRNGNKPTEEGRATSHSQVFYFLGHDTSKITMEEINFIGNAPRVEDMRKSGGLICMKVCTQEFYAYNNISTSWYIPYFANGTQKRFEINKCKAYDSFNCFLYSWGSGDVHFVDSEMIGAGGPIVIQDHYKPGDENERLSKTYFENCVLESYVSGTEGWFTSVGATTAASAIKSLDKCFTPFGRSILKESADGTTYFNCIVINKASTAEGPTAVKCGGSVKINDYAAFNYGADDPYAKGFLDKIYSFNAPALQTSAADPKNSINDYAFISQVGITDKDQKQILDPNHAIFKGDYICIYYMGMAIVLGYNNMNGTAHEIYTPAK